MKENDSHGYCDLSLSAEAARLAPEGLLVGLNNMPGWKAVIRQLEDQMAAGPTTQQATADQAEGLLGFTDQMLQAPYTPSPMCPTRRRQHDALEEDGEDDEEGGGSGNNEGILTLLQRLEDSIGHMRGEMGVWSSDARYLTLHGGLVTLGKEHTSLHQDILAVTNELKAAGQQVNSSKAEVHQVQLVTASLGAKVAHLVQALSNGGDVDSLRWEVQGLKADWADLESTVLALTNAVTSLMEAATSRPSSSPNTSYLDVRLTAYNAAINGHLDSLRQDEGG